MVKFIRRKKYEWEQCSTFSGATFEDPYFGSTFSLRTYLEFPMEWGLKKERTQESCLKEGIQKYSSSKVAPGDVEYYSPSYFFICSDKDDSWYYHVSLDKVVYVKSCIKMIPDITMFSQ